ncbi:MAG TPA: MBL fold metallo-hydrolase [Gemmatimonadaceae bacterium]|nr:MBL fold metallo-hydrolase [Gemmatimonadaceae bacterium]
MKVTAITVGPFEENCYLIVDDSGSGNAVLVDPGDEGKRILREVDRAGARIGAIWLTHAHLDHIGGIASVRDVWDAPIHLHPLDRPLYDAGALQAAHYGLPFEEPPPPDRTLSDGDTLSVGTLRFSVMHVPGHAPGHVAFYGEGVVFGGDCLFAGSIGRSDLPFSNSADLSASLDRLISLPPETLVHSGHGPSTTIGAEIRSNPFLPGAPRLSPR